MQKLKLDKNKLTEEEKVQLKLWTRATPMQRLDWLEEAQKIAYQSGAWQQYMSKDKTRS